MTVSSPSPTCPPFPPPWLALVGLPGRAWADADLTRAERSIGKPDAKATVNEYFSLTCTHCAAFAQTTLTQVEDQADRCRTGSVGVP